MGDDHRDFCTSRVMDFSPKSNEPWTDQIPPFLTNQERRTLSFLGLTGFWAQAHQSRSIAREVQESLWSALYTTRAEV